MLAWPHSALLIDKALDRLGITEEDRGPPFLRILHAAQFAMFRRPVPSKRVTSGEIMSAVKAIEAALWQISKAVNKIDDARATVGADDTRRTEAVEIVQRAALGAIADAILARIPGVLCTDDQLAEAMPKYGPGASFSNSWNHTFSESASRIGKLREIYVAEDFRSETRTREEWLARALHELASIYEDLKGDSARVYRKGGDTASDDWMPQFQGFIWDLWPVFSVDEAEAKRPPSATKIENHLRLASELPPLDNE